MKDIFVELKKENLKRHIAVGVTAFIFAVSANALIFSTDTGLKLQASALEATGKSSTLSNEPDISLAQAQAGTDRIQIRVGKDAKNVTSLEFSLLSDPESIVFGEVASDSKAEIITSSTTPGVLFVKFLFPAPTDITAGQIASIGITKKQEAPVNISASRLMTKSGDFELSSAGVIVK